MAWNEPGNNGGPGNSGGQGPNDPWGRKQGQQQPPDLDELLTKLRERFGGGKSGGGGNKSGGGGSGLPSKGFVSLLAIVAALLWLASGIYIVDEQENGVVLQFGKYHTTTPPGLRWHLPSPFQSVEKVNVTKVSQTQERSSMLTQDENIVDITLQVQYRVSDAQRYLFSLRDPDSTLREATKSAIREVVGKSDMDFIITAGRQAVATRAEELLQDTLDSYESGLFVLEVNLEKADPPAPVRGAFADAIKAREDQQRLINEAEAFANEILPRARGEAARQLEQASAYETRVTERAKGDADRFSALLTEYKRAPEVTRDRLYLDAMNIVLGNTGKVLVDVDESSPLLYLPLDKLGERVRPRNNGTGGSTSSRASAASTGGSNFQSNADAARQRGRR